MQEATPVGELRASAARVANSLRDLLHRIPPAGSAKPGELTLRLCHHSDVWSGAAMFSFMACTAVHAKYHAAHRPHVAGELLRLRTYAAKVCQTGRQPGWDDMQVRRARLVLAHKRLGPHATRQTCGDPDLAICRANARGFAYYATPWVCQQPDWRFRWTPTGLNRLRFMVDCWDRYARCRFAPYDWLIGLNDFPLSDRLRPDSLP
jgi:hypothetical protein